MPLQIGITSYISRTGTVLVYYSKCVLERRTQISRRNSDAYSLERRCYGLFLEVRELASVELHSLQRELSGHLVLLRISAYSVISLNPRSAMSLVIFTMARSIYSTIHAFRGPLAMRQPRRGPPPCSAAAAARSGGISPQLPTR